MDRGRVGHDASIQPLSFSWLLKWWKMIADIQDVQYA